MVESEKRKRKKNHRIVLMITEIKSAAECIDERMVTVSCSLQEAVLSVLDELFPSFASEGVLQVGDAFEVTEAKYFSKHRVVRHPERTLLISVSDVDDVNGVAEKRDAVSLNEAQKHHIVRPPFSA